PHPSAASSHSTSIRKFWQLLLSKRIPGRRTRATRGAEPPPCAASSAFRTSGRAICSGVLGKATRRHSSPRATAFSASAPATRPPSVRLPPSSIRLPRLPALCVYCSLVAEEGDPVQEVDAVLVGAGHNGLAAAALLAKRGLRVVCLEKNHYVGGMAGTPAILTPSPP